MENINFEEYLEYVYNKADQHDSWWLQSWIEDTTEQYIQESGCVQCGSKIKEIKDIWSKTHNHILQEETVCSKCGFVIAVQDRREGIRDALKNGGVKVKDVAILTEELKENK